MSEFYILINSIEAVKDFVTICNKSKFDDCYIYLYSKRYIIDAKSIMGVFSIDLNNKLLCRIETEDVNLMQEFKTDISKYIVDR